MTKYEQLAGLKPTVMVKDSNSTAERTINGAYAFDINGKLSWYFSLDKPLSNGGNCIPVRDLIKIIS